MKPEATLDLHGLRAEAVIPAVERFVSASRRSGLRKVLIIHGKGKHSQGEPVLQRLVRAYLERSPHAGAFGPADRAMGGSGATWAALREPKKR
jgi:DNA-nicking Smr family endonuclease